MSKKHKAMRVINKPDHYWNKYIYCLKKREYSKLQTIQEHENSTHYMDDLIGGGLHGFDNMEMELFLKDDLSWLTLVENPQLYAALQTLTPTQLIVVDLVCRRDLTHQQIADFLGIQRRNVTYHFNSSIARLKKYLK